jgi:secreted PhoX family phosphatase
MGEYFGDILKRALDRKDFLKLTGASAVVFSSPFAHAKTKNKPTKSLSYKTIYPNNEDRVIVPKGYRTSILIKWGDPRGCGKAEEVPWLQRRLCGLFQANLQQGSVGGKPRIHKPRAHV